MTPFEIYKSDIGVLITKAHLNDDDIKVLKSIARDSLKREEIIRNSFPNGIDPELFKSAIRLQYCMSMGTHYLKSFGSEGQDIGHCKPRFDEENRP